MRCGHGVPVAPARVILALRRYALDSCLMTHDASAPLRPSAGIHHVTAIGGPAQRTLDFYGGVLGLRLVKRTVNFDDPTTWHFYFGDAEGAPGSLLTVFPWEAARRGRAGTGQAAVTALAVPPASLGWWLQRLVLRGVRHAGPRRRFPDADGVPTESYLSLEDEDGMLLELVGDPRVADLPGWAPEAMPGGVPAEHAVGGAFGEQLWADDPAPTAAVLRDVLGFTAGPHDGVTSRWLAAGDPAVGRVVDLRAIPGFWRAGEGVGTVHHVAFRAADDAHELAMKAAAQRAGISTTTVRDRHYFRSVYFREPGGVLFELATDGPGFRVDEPSEALGAALQLPPALAAMRADIARSLPPVTWPPSAERPRSAFEDLPLGHDRAADDPSDALPPDAA